MLVTVRVEPLLDIVFTPMFEMLPDESNISRLYIHVPCDRILPTVKSPEIAYITLEVFGAVNVSTRLELLCARTTDLYVIPLVGLNGTMLLCE